MFDSLRKLLGIAGQIGGGVAENAQKSFRNAITLDKPPAAQDGPVRPIRPGAQPYYPGTGPNSTMPYQPDNTPVNGPWAVGSPIPSFMGQKYADNPESPEFVGPNAVDPRIFGYGPDGPVQQYGGELKRNINQAAFGQNPQSGYRIRPPYKY